MTVKKVMRWKSVCRNLMVKSLACRDRRVYEEMRVVADAVCGRVISNDIFGVWAVCRNRYCATMQ